MKTLPLCPILYASISPCSPVCHMLLVLPLHCAPLPPASTAAPAKGVFGTWRHTIQPLLPFSPCKIGTCTLIGPRLMILPACSRTSRGFLTLSPWGLKVPCKTQHTAVDPLRVSACMYTKIMHGPLLTLAISTPAGLRGHHLLQLCCGAAQLCLGGWQAAGGAVEEAVGQVDWQVWRPGPWQVTFAAAVAPSHDACLQGTWACLLGAFGLNWRCMSFAAGSSLG